MALLPLPDRALVIAEPWISLILSGRKTWEMRGRGTSIRGRIGLIRKGTGLVVGEAVLAGSLPPLDVEGMLATQSRHRIDPETLAALGGRWNVPWVLEGAMEWKAPVPYVHPRGAVTWVVLRQDACALKENAIT